ncbi:hypothetical protein F5B21DRAFT_183680 [Xylaria acuta]|nr:hypothetical protein F5B21DRAFT_183680 [Xylaria acuta]
MAYSGNPVQKHNYNPEYMHSKMQDEANVYDLDDPYLIPKFLSRQQQYPRATASSITCRFSAIPLNEPYVFFHNMAQYGYIIHESRDKLIMRLPYYSLALLNRVRQVWVSKYLAPFTECHITFDMPRRDPGQTTLVIIQRVLPKTNKSSSSGADDALVVGNGTADIDTVADDGRTALLPGLSGGDAVPRLARRVCDYY